ncbi:ATP-binding protein [Leifsonia sp. NPDC058248]|uniref:sensor histidine kinase n=1 Tax=Leifsonia sp. NPDC058248 TaxID=3346402 RepID=UPI0036DD5AA6
MSDSTPEPAEVRSGGARPRSRVRPVRLSVRVRILATLLLVAGLGMVVAGTTAYLVQRERVLMTVDDRLSSLVSDAKLVATDSGATTLDDVMTAIIQRLRPGANESSLAIIGGAAALSPGGSVDFRIDADRALVTRVAAETAAGDVVRGTITTPGDRTLRYIATPVKVTTDARTGIFVAAVDLRAELRPLTEAFRTYAIVAAIALVVVGIVGWFVAGRLLRPIRALTEATNRINASDLTERIPVVGDDDISQLTTTVNGMLDRLEGALTAQRQLLDDVGHELKTPLTIVRGHLELVDVDDPSDVAASRDLAIDELDRMSGLVADITRLAGAGRAGDLRIETVDVADLTERIRAKAAAIADREWVVTQHADGTAELDADRITQAMLQLAANAVAHGQAGGGRIELGSMRSGTDRLRFWVRDFGPGIPVDAQARIFERFQRGSSEHGRGPGGSGLGLAIVASIAAAHGGFVTVDSEPGQGATFTIELPFAHPAARPLAGPAKGTT